MRRDGIIFFDTDCISAFLWTDEGSIVAKLFDGRIVFPQVVIDEMSKAPDAKLLQRCNELTQAGHADVWDIDSRSPALLDYVGMTEGSMGRAIGKGEAAAIALAKSHGGVVASNNLRDVREYVERYRLDHITTAGILLEAYENAIISESEGNAIWANMMSHGRQLGAGSFTEYLSKRPRNPIAKHS